MFPFSGASVAFVESLGPLPQECSGLQRGTVSGVLASGVLRVQWEVYWSLVKNLGALLLLCAEC